MSREFIAKKKDKRIARTSFSGSDEGFSLIVMNSLFSFLSSSVIGALYFAIFFPAQEERKIFTVVIVRGMPPLFYYERTQKECGKILCAHCRVKGSERKAFCAKRKISVCKRYERGNV